MKFKKPGISRVVLITISVFVGFLLYNRPKEAENKNNTKKQSQIHPQKTYVPASEIVEKSDSLFFVYKSISNKEKKSNFADSIFRELATQVDDRLETAALLAEKIAKEVEELESLVRHGNICYIMYLSVLNQAKKDYYGNKAMLSFDKILEIFPGDETIMTRKAVLTVYLEQPPMKGIGMLKELVENNPSNTEALIELAKFQYKVGKYEKSRISYEQALLSDSSNIQALVGAADCYYVLSNTEKSLNYYKSALNLLGEGDERKHALKLRIEEIRNN